MVLMFFINDPSDFLSLLTVMTLVKSCVMQQSIWAFSDSTAPLLTKSESINCIAFIFVNK